MYHLHVFIEQILFCREELYMVHSNKHSESLGFLLLEVRHKIAFSLNYIDFFFSLVVRKEKGKKYRTTAGSTKEGTHVAL